MLRAASSCRARRCNLPLVPARLRERHELRGETGHSGDIAARACEARHAFGALAPMLEAFLPIQSFAFWRLSSVPALSSQTVTVLPPSLVRSVKGFVSYSMIPKQAFYIRLTLLQKIE